MKKIVPCKCPNCGIAYEEYWSCASPDILFEDEIIIVYRITCEECKCVFDYREIYQLRETKVKGR